ncbi:MAG: hypothetical protein ABW022_13110 [Actinoplanes sp.]
MQFSADCVFCQPSDLAVWRSDDLWMLLDPAPLTEGHALICSVGHYPSAADLTAGMAGTLERACAWARDLYLEEYGTFALFEHGRTGHCVRRSPQEQICHHAHVHVLPLPGDLAEHIPLSQSTRWDTWPGVATLAGELDGYLVLETGSGRRFYPITRPLAPHFLRTEAAKLIGDETLADWEQVLREPAARAKVERARTRLGARIASKGLPVDARWADGQEPGSPWTTSDVHRSTMSTSP